MRTDAPPKRILIIEDDPATGLVLEDLFELNGYDVDRALDGPQALQLMTILPAYDLVLLDVMLPQKSGFDVLREARRAGVDSPVIVLTALDEDIDKLQGFDLGADDYVAKPFHTEELEARVRAVLRRSKPEPSPQKQVICFGDVELRLDDRTGRKSGDDVAFTGLEFEILKYFIEHQGRTVNRKQLLRDVWGISGDITTRTIDRHVASIRKKIEDDPDQPRHIETVYGIGYKFVG
jgi:DNA-binding response OmpR family regulator